MKPRKRLALFVGQVYVAAINLLIVAAKGVIMMAVQDDATAALNRLQASVDAAVTEITAPHPTDAFVASLATGMNAQSDRLDAAVASQQQPAPPAS